VGSTQHLPLKEIDAHLFNHVLTSSSFAGHGEVYLLRCRLSGLIIVAVGVRQHALLTLTLSTEEDINGSWNLFFVPAKLPHYGKENHEKCVAAVSRTAHPRCATRSLRRTTTIAARARRNDLCPCPMALKYRA
jgi:hypothetical protein